MSTAAPAPTASRPRVVSKGWIKVPSSLIENQAALTHAEFSLALVVLRRSGGRENTPVTITDENWKNWTGLSPRLKEYAIAGLKRKGVSVVGRGEDARYLWQPQKWSHYVRHADRTRPRTLGRKEGVKAKPGAIVHPECRARGCAMLPRQDGKLLPFPVPDAQPVAQTEIASGPSGECSGGPVTRELTLGDGTLREASSPLPPVPDAQPVAQVETEQTPWPVTLATIRKFFPIVTVEFVAKLAATVQTQYPALRSVVDQELAGAVNVAYAYKRQYQKGEGLFLATVPAALKMLRAKPLVNARAEAKAVGRIRELLNTPEAREILRRDAEERKKEGLGGS